jgi:hypothetical protein
MNYSFEYITVSVSPTLELFSNVGDERITLIEMDVLKTAPGLYNMNKNQANYE